MSSINLGSFNANSSGSATGLGFISNLDSEALIEAALSGRQSLITENEETIETNNEKIEAIGELETILERLQTTVDFLRAPTGVLNENNDFFKHTNATLTSNTSIEASTYLAVTSESDATLGNYTIENITRAAAHQLRKDGFTSQTASVVGNASVTDNYQASLGTVSGSVLNATTPITFSNDVQGNKATIDVVFGDQNVFDAADSITFGATTITFGGGGGNDIDISGASTVADKVAAIVTRMNAITTGEESRYTYTSSGTTLTVTRDVDGSNSEVDTSLTIGANFSNTDTTQTVKIGSQAAANNPAGGDLNSLGTDGDQGTTAQAAVLEMMFGTQNKFDATDNITFGNTTITFGGTGGNDIDISTATTLDQKIDAIVTRMNAVTTGPENTYTYARNSTGVLTITQDTAGTIASTGNDMTVTANFATGTTNTTQTVAFGKNYKNNASTSGSVARSNSSVSGTVSGNGVDGYAAATKANINIVFNNNNIDGTDTITIGSTTVAFSTIGVGGDLATTLHNIADYFNNLTSGDEAGYSYSTNGSTTLTITRDTYGSGATLALNADLSNGADTANTVAIGSQSAANNPAGGTLAALGTDGVNQTAITDASTTHISTLSGAITIDSATYIAGSSTATTFEPNVIEFKATVGGVTYTSRPVALDGGTIDADGDGDNGLGNRIASGTVITFVKDTDGDTTAETKDVTFQLTVGDERTGINNSGVATTYAGEINTWLNTTNTITTTQSPTVPEFRAGTFNLGGVDITLNEGDNLQVIKSKINAVSSTSGVSADIVQVSESSFSLVLKATETGIENKIFEFSDGDVGDGPTGTIQIGLDNVTFTEATAASDSSFDLDGQTITRSTNTINDVIDKLTFSLISDTPVSTDLTVSIGSDNSLIKTGITDFLTAYNDLKFFVSEQTERDEDNELVETAILGDESLLREIMTALDAQITRTIDGIATTEFNTLFEVGIDFIDFPGDGTTPKTENIFVIDEDKFDAALASDFEAFRDVFTFTFTANSPELSLFSSTNSTTLTDYILDIDTSRAEGNQVRVLDATTNNFLFNATLEDNTITGIEGTSLEGIVLVYTGDGSDLITVSQTRGIAAGLHNLVSSYLDLDGLVDDAVNAFTDENDRIQERIDTDTEILAIERQLLVEQFTNLEAVINQANQVISLLDAQQKADAANS